MKNLCLSIFVYHTPLASFLFVLHKENNTFSALVIRSLSVCVSYRNNTLPTLDIFLGVQLTMPTIALPRPVWVSMKKQKKLKSTFKCQFESLGQK